MGQVDAVVSGGGLDTLTYICHNTRTNSFLKWNHRLSKRTAKCYVFCFLFVFMHNSWLICRSCIFIWFLHLQKNVPSSFQTGPRLELPAPERNSRTIRAAAARQPVLQQGSLHWRAAIICQTTTSGWIYRWEWKIRSLIQTQKAFIISLLLRYNIL